MDVIQNDHYVLVQRKSQMSLHQLPKKQGKVWYLYIQLNQLDWLNRQTPFYIG